MPQYDTWFKTKATLVFNYSQEEMMSLVQKVQISTDTGATYTTIWDHNDPNNSSLIFNEALKQATYEFTQEGTYMIRAVSAQDSDFETVKDIAVILNP